MRSRVERFVLGIGMTIVAFVLERRVIRAIRRRGDDPPPPARDVAEGPVFNVTEE